MILTSYKINVDKNNHGEMEVCTKVTEEIYEHNHLTLTASPPGLVCRNVACASEGRLGHLNPKGRAF